MKSVTIGVVTLALAVSGCSMFDHHSNDATATPASDTQPAMSNTASPPPSTPPATSNANAGSGMNGMSNSNDSASGEHGMLSRSVVRQAQRDLKSDGLYKGRIDGKAGPETKRAVTAYQKKNNLQTSGRLDHETLQSMNISENGDGSNSGQSSMKPGQTDNGSNGGSMSGNSNSGGMSGNSNGDTMPGNSNGGAMPGNSNGGAMPSHSNAH